MKKQISRVLALLLVLSLVLGACGKKPVETVNTEEPSSTEANTPETKEPGTDEPSTEAPAVDLRGKKIEVAAGWADKKLEKMQELIAQFTEETGIEVELVTYAGEYENTMKTRMAAQNLPDVWTTHGWAKMRYGEYLMDLSGEDWVQYLKEDIKKLVTDENGYLYAMSGSMTECAMAYNKDVLAAAGVDPADLVTLDKFEEACEKIKNAGYIPLGSYGNEKRYIMFLAPTFYTTGTSDTQYYQKLADGTFDWTTDGKLIFEKMQDWYNRGFFAEDVATLTGDDCNQQFADGKVAFAFDGGNFPNSVANKNPDAKLGLMPVPALDESGKMTFFVGEGGGCFGVYKDTKEPEAAKAFVAFFARPDINIQVCEVMGNVSAMTNVDDGDSREVELLNEAKEIFKDAITYDNMFDRQYLPNGTYGLAGTAWSVWTADPNEETLKQVMQSMQDGYLEKLAAARGQ